MSTKTVAEWKHLWHHTDQYQCISSLIVAIKKENDTAAQELTKIREMLIAETPGYHTPADLSTVDLLNLFIGHYKRHSPI